MPGRKKKNGFCKKLNQYLDDPRIGLFAALACGQRLEILRLLQNSEKCVSEITPELGIDISVVSRHLQVLKNAGLIRSRKEGTNSYYSVADKRIFSILEDAISILRDRARETMNRYK